MDIKLTLERLEGNRAFLKDEKGRLIVWPRDFLPENIAEKEIVEVKTSRPGAAEEDSELPKKILNELLMDITP